MLRLHLPSDAPISIMLLNLMRCSMIRRTADGIWKSSEISLTILAPNGFSNEFATLKTVLFMNFSICRTLSHGSHEKIIVRIVRHQLLEWDLYTMCKLCGDWKTILIDFSPELIPACLGQNQCPQT